ncbi:RNA-directed DNA polymerase, eukaryota [Tanacetum coccineum]|uniref:RNA-directed DNA polymerase, eukaryota n=1 Tax=Tanacetum coccineum TaxID=301880 RepID=A0ABQ5CN07_9ASTR
MENRNRLSTTDDATEEGRRPVVERCIQPSEAKYKTAAISLPREDIEKQFGRTMKEAAKNLNVGLSTLKRRCKDHGISEWRGPNFRKRKSNGSHSKQININEADNVSMRDSLAINRGKCSDSNTLTIKAEYGDDLIKFHLPISLATFEAIETEICDRFMLVRATYKLKYLDEDKEWILMTSDQDMRDCLIDLPLGGYSYTWAHKSASKMSKLDRFLISEGLLVLFPQLTGLCLDRHLSDHRPIIMYESNMDYGPTPFRLFYSWLKIDGFDKFVADTWRTMNITDLNGLIRMKKKLQFLKNAIKPWVKDNRKKINEAKTSIQCKLIDVDKIIDQGGGNEEVLNQRASLLKDLNDINSSDVLDLSQKAKVHWSIEGDENLKYFHGILNSKRSQLAIRGILLEVDWIVDPKRVKSEFYNHFVNQFLKPMSPQVNLEFQLPKRLNSEQVEDLERPILYEEIKKAVWDCGAVLEFFASSKFPSGCNSTLIALIPKTHDAKVVKDFRPISLIGSIYKIIAKILANQLSFIMSDLVGASMSRLNSWKETMAKVSSRLSKLKLKTLSIGACLTLLKYVLSAIPIYHMSLFKVPAGILKDLESIREVALKTTYPRLFARKDISVAEKLAHSSLDIILPHIQDRWSWSLNASGDFSVSSVRNVIDDVFLPKLDVPTIWVKEIPIKINILARKISLDRLPTRANLSARTRQVMFKLESEYPFRSKTEHFGYQRPRLGVPFRDKLRIELIYSFVIEIRLLDLKSKEIDPSWNMDTGASSHLNSHSSNLSTVYNNCLYPSVRVGDGKTILVTNTGHSILPTLSRPLYLYNVLVTPNIIKNLISVHQFTRDNKCSVEFDEFGFSVKDFLTRHILLRCDSSGDLYPVTKPSPTPSALLSVSHATWHQRLGHPGAEVLRSLISHNSI